MANPFDILRGMLRNEGSRGHDNKTVSGGLDKYIPAFEQQARKAGVDEALITEVAAWLRSYGALTPEQRPEAIATLLPKLPASGAFRPPRTNSNRPSQPAAGPPSTASRAGAPAAKPQPSPAEIKSSPAAHEPAVQNQKTAFTQNIEAAPVLETVQGERETGLPAVSSAPDDLAARSQPQAQPVPRRDRPPGPRPPAQRPKPYAPAKRKALPAEPAGVGTEAPLTVLRGIGPKQAENLERLGLRTMGEALYYFPRRYVDYSELKTINRLEYGEEITLVATVWETTVRRIRGGQAQMVQTILSDSTGVIQVTWFNQPWLRSRLMEGKQVQVAGRVDQYLGRLTLQNPALEEVDKESLETGRIVPVYSLTQGISPVAMRRWMYEAVGYTAPKVSDPLPERIRTRARLLPLSEALLQIHFPDSQEMLAAARKRLAFDEMFLLQLGVQQQRAERKADNARPLSAADEALKGWIAALPYTLTGAQQNALADIRADLSRATPMNRLLQGDVGSGKTVAAALAMAVAVEAGAQAAMMAPTAILAEQHYLNISKLLAPAQTPQTPSVSQSRSVSTPSLRSEALRKTLRDSQIALLLGATPDSEKQKIYAGLREGSIKIVIGTQALIQNKVEFATLGLVVMDEQHRFGVAQRAKLRGKGSAGAPHVLVMTATPIPRTLALTVYGELDLSIINEMPPGRLPVETRIVYVNERERAYAFLRQQVQQGRQAYVICPLVEESEKIEAKAAVEEYERLQTQVFPDLRLGLLHGRMKAEEKETVMARFRAGEIQALVSTSVVEVGVDVPNASVVLVEGANRFGLSQLHQLRGRVGRGAHQSYCLLASDLGSNAKDESNVRLKAMEEIQDGFVLAEKDLALRGPGEFLGTRQSGFGDLKLARLTDLPLIDLARREAIALLEIDPNLSQANHAALAKQLSEFWRKIEGAGDVS